VVLASESILFFRFGLNYKEIGIKRRETECPEELNLI
jgi:hypothetical protein